MGQQRWLLSMITVLALGLAADYFFLHFLFPMKRAAIMEEMNRGVEESLEDDPTPARPIEEPTPPTVGAPAAAEANSETGVAPTATSDAFTTSLKVCFGADSSDASPQALAQRLEAGGVAERDVPIENWHIRKADGTEERIMMVTSDRENAQGKKEVRLFGVDGEGLPVPKKLPEDSAFDPKPAFVQGLRGAGKQTFHQKKEVLKYANGMSANIEWVNGQIQDAQFFTPDRTLSCRQRECRCQL